MGRCGTSALPGVRNLSISANRIESFVRVLARLVDSKWRAPLLIREALSSRGYWDDRLSGQSASVTLRSWVLPFRLIVTATVSPDFFVSR